MDINKNTAIQLWDERYDKDTQVVFDFAGRKMTKGQFGDTNSKSGWTIDHRQPQSRGGKNVKCNLEIVNHVTNTEKADKTTFTANGKQFQVQKDSESGKSCYKIVELESSSAQKTKKKTESRGDIAEKLFNDTITDDKDIAGRYINFNSFETDDDDAWSIGYFTNNKTISLNNCFVAHVKTIADQEGKSSFKSNDMVFELKKIDGNYHYINVSKIDDKFNFLNVVGYTNYLYKQESTIFKDLITLKVKYKEDSEFSKFLILLEELMSSVSLKNNYLLSEGNIFYNFYDKDRKIHILFETPKEQDTCTVHEFAMLMNTLRKMFINMTSITDLTIYHSVHKINANQYLKFFEDIDRHFVNKVNNNKTNTIYLTEDVKNYLAKCKYTEDSFTKTSSYNSYFERNYIYNKLLDLIKKY